VTWVRNFAGNIHAPAGKDHYAPGFQRGAKLFQDVRVPIKRYMPDAVPPRDEIESLREFPIANVCVVEHHLRMPPFGKGEHLRRDIQSFDLKAARQQ